MSGRAQKKMRATGDVVAMKCRRAYFFLDSFVYFSHQGEK